MQLGGSPGVHNSSCSCSSLWWWCLTFYTLHLLEQQFSTVWSRDPFTLSSLIYPVFMLIPCFFKCFFFDFCDTTLFLNRTSDYSFSGFLVNSFYLTWLLNVWVYFGSAVGHSSKFRLWEWQIPPIYSSHLNTQGLGAPTPCSQKSVYNFTVRPLYPWFCICRFNQLWIM